MNLRVKCNFFWVIYDGKYDKIWLKEVLLAGV